CYGCDAHGDAPTLVMRLKGVEFPEAVRFLAGKAPLPKGSTPLATPKPAPAKAPQPAPERSSKLSAADALGFRAEGQERLWASEGAKALDYLRGRGLTDATIRSARLGYHRAQWPRGIVVPWLDGDQLMLVKVRQPDGKRPKYVELYRDAPLLYPSPSAVR